MTQGPVVKVPRRCFDDGRGRFVTVESRGSAQTNLVVTTRAGTIRGLHYQRHPHEQNKLIQVIRGRIFDVAVFPNGEAGEWNHLDDWSDHALLIPGEMAHGYQTLEDDTIVLYHTSAPYLPASEGGLRWDDPKLGIPWPLVPTMISEKDAAWPLL